MKAYPSSTIDTAASKTSQRQRWLARSQRHEPPGRPARLGSAAMESQLRQSARRRQPPWSQREQPEGYVADGTVAAHAPALPNRKVTCCNCRCRENRPIPPCPNTPRARPPSRRTGRLERAASRGVRCETPRGRLSAAAADSCRLAPSTEAAVQAAGADRLTARRSASACSRRRSLAGLTGGGRVILTAHERAAAERPLGRSHAINVPRWRPR